MKWQGIYKDVRDLPTVLYTWFRHENFGELRAREPKASRKSSIGEMKIHVKVKVNSTADP